MPAEKCEFCGKFGATKSREFVDTYTYHNDGTLTLYLCPRCRNKVHEKWRPVFEKRMSSCPTLYAADLPKAEQKSQTIAEASDYVPPINLKVERS